MKRKTEFKSVITLSRGSVVAITIPFLIIWASLYYWLFGDRLLGRWISIFTVLCMGSFYLFLKLIAVDLKIWFDENYMYVQKNNQKFKKYLKNDIRGFYAFDYESPSSDSKKYLRFIFNDGHKLHIYDTEYRIKKDQTQLQELKTFLKTAKRELNFEKLNCKNWFQQIYWYSQKQVLHGRE